MTIEQLVKKYNMNVATKNVDANREVKSAYCCDLLSRVMAKGTSDMALITIHTHMNVIAIATLLDMACVIIPENAPIETEVIEKAEEEGICLLQSADSAYEISGKLYSSGIKPSSK